LGEGLEDTPIRAQRHGGGSCEQFRELLCSNVLGAATGPEKEDEGEEPTSAAVRPVSKKKAVTAGRIRNRNQEYQHSHRIGEKVWKTDVCTTDASDRGSPGNMHENEYKDHLDALTTQTKKTDKFEDPFNEQRCRNAMYNPSKDERSIDDALSAIMSGTKRPNREQQDFLEHFTERLKTERREQLGDHINRGSGEPLLDLVHGFPGTGKSAVIAWMRQLMEDGLGWEHGSQFVCLAFQNAMAAQISGHTVHHWSGILVTSDGGPGLGDMHKLSMKCQALRVIIIDEVSMMDAELLGKLREKVTKAVRIQKTLTRRGLAIPAEISSPRERSGVSMWSCAQTSGSCTLSQALSWLRTRHAFPAELLLSKPWRCFGGKQKTQTPSGSSGS